MTFSVKDIPDSPHPESWVWGVQSFPPGSEVSQKGPEDLYEVSLQINDRDSINLFPFFIGVILFAVAIGIVSSVLAVVLLNCSIKKAAMVYLGMLAGATLFLFLWQAVAHVTSEWLNKKSI